MLQRAASNAYSWWWASHIRTKQSKWLEQNLQDMEEKVQSVLRLIEEDGDSFAKRAEMYYKKRPELINFVEESYRAYRALADRYDHMSTELQNANNTIAYVFPEQVQFSMEEEEEENILKKTKNVIKGNGSINVPKVPKIPKKLLHKRDKKPQMIPHKEKSGMIKEEGMKKIDYIQKQILTLQTEKEFVKSSYENSLAKFWEIDQNIRDMQEKVSLMEDEFGTSVVIEDEEARELMAKMALNSCAETLNRLNENQEKLMHESSFQKKRIIEANKKLSIIKNEVKKYQKMENDEETEEEKERIEIQDKIKEQFKITENFTIIEMAEKIDNLVSKVVCLESAVSSQVALVKTLKHEIDELYVQIKAFEDEKSQKSIEKLCELEDQIKELDKVNIKIEEQNQNLKMHFTEAHSNLNHLHANVNNISSAKTVEKFTDSNGVILDNKSNSNIDKSSHEVNNSFLPKEEVTIQDETSFSFEDTNELKEIKSPIEENSSTLIHSNVYHDSNVNNIMQETKSNVEIDEEIIGKEEEMLSKGKLGELLEMKMEEKEEEPDWKKLYMDGMDGKEKILLLEYTNILRNFKEMKKNINKSENVEGKSLFDVTVQLMKLKNSNAKKDEQIQSLKQKLNILQQGVDNDVKSLIISQHEITSETEQKFRTNIDELLEENLEFWLRFSTTFQQIQKFDVEVKDLQLESSKLEEKTVKQEGSSTPKLSLKSEAKPLYKHLREVHAVLGIWMEKSALLKDELKQRFSSLCDIQEDINVALKQSAEEENFSFTSYQAAKFQGEILNMKQENNKVADELQAGLDHVTTLQLEVERSLAKLNEKFKLSGSKNDSSIQLNHSESRSRVPLRSFIFGVKPKKQKNFIFSCMHPMLHRKYKE